MNMTKALIITLLTLTFFTLGIICYLIHFNPLTFIQKPVEQVLGYPIYLAKTAPQKIESAVSQKPIFPEIPHIAKPASAYTILLVGDSMTEFLGENTDQLRKHLKQHYGEKVFGIFNLGFGSTNILSLQDRIEKESFHLNKQYPSINSREFELIIIESFANNPLSQFPLAEGLKKQDEALDLAVRTIHAKHPDSVIAFMATIAPLRNRYGENTVNLSPEVRQQWADERIAYLKNHIKFAQQHNIPLINIYEKSLTPEGDGNIDYINTTDFIHPSVTGIDFISKNIADWIYDNRVLPL